MKLKNIKRNSLDYILTDILPVELSELFTLRYFYEFLQNHVKELKSETQKIIGIKNAVDKQTKLFEDNKLWASTPLKFNIAKGQSGNRELNVLQPIAAVQLYYFIATYQDELLRHLDTNSVFSLRYHQKANSLHYKMRRKNVTQYFNETSANLSKRVLEQTGRYFDLKPYSSIVSFTNSDEWYDFNLKYKYFARMDYKSCFDSIYTHTYKWSISKDVNDSKGFKNTNIFTTIDRILQNINSLTSNGLVVGPEFSRLIAELLLQQVDMNVYSALLKEGITLGKQYAIRRYVDDLFIFTDTEEIREKIISLYDIASQKFLLQLNSTKLIKEKLPFILTTWLNQASTYCTNLSSELFYSQEELRRKDDNSDVHFFKGRTFLSMKTVLKRNFNDLISSFPQERTKLVSYGLGTFLNKVSSIKGNNQHPIFGESVSEGMIFELIDLVTFIYSHAPTFDNTQKYISIISYINDDICLVEKHRVVLQKIINKYAYIFSQSNSNDVVNLILFCAQCQIEVPFEFEMRFKENLYRDDNPIAIATFFLYSKYNEAFFNEVKTEINSKIAKKLDAIRDIDNLLLYKEFWWLILFNKCPYVTSEIQQRFDALLTTLKTKSIGTDVGCLTLGIYCDFLQTSSEQFFSWDINNRSLLREITYRTHERTIFKNYRYGQTGYTSIE
ncbi:MAG: RNA-directed DNA polymerase [Oscillospiraceae bacterium]